MYCKNCGKNLNQGEIFCANCGAKVENENNIIVRNNFDQNIQNPTMSNVNNLDNNINQNQQVTTIDVDQELRKAYIDKNAEKILKGRGGSAWLFLFGATYLLYRKLYLYGFIYFLINFVLSYFNLAGVCFIIQIVLCFFFYKIYLNYVDKKISSIKKNNPNLSFEQLKEKCRKQGGVSYAMIALSIGISLIIGFISYKPSSDKIVCTSDKGNITIMYNEEGITGYKANGMSYDLDAQKEHAKEIGMDAYITEFDNWFKSNASGYCTINGEKVSEENNIEEDTPNQDIVQEGKRVGSDEFGYITIPENWTNFIDVDENSTLQYSYANIYIATLYAVPTTQIDAYNYASNIMNKLKSEGVQNVQGATVNVGKYSAYQVYGYSSNENIWLVCWFFETEDGKTHYISIEGPDRNSEYFNIPESFSLNK